MKFYRLLAICFIFCLVFSSCVSANDDTKYTGMRADEENVSSVKQSIKDKENSFLADDGDVFWTESGKNWHRNYDCSHLANSKVVIHGTIEEAKLASKEKECDRCYSGTLDSYYDAIEGKEYNEGDVFFTKDGTVWHTDINCAFILGAEKIYYADEMTATLLGKSGCCTECER